MQHPATVVSRAWHRNAPWLWLLAPLSVLFALVSTLRRRAYRRGLLKSWRCPAPVIVVGNISVGGTGKTPLVAALAEHLVASGYRPGIASRGYGGTPPLTPLTVTRDTPAEHCGDEPLLLARRTGRPVVVDADRCAAARCLVEKHGCDIVISDDGLQHYRLQRDIEIAVLDGRRGLGNRRRLPMGPLREPVSRLAAVSAIVINGADQVAGMPYAAHRMDLVPARLVSLESGEQLTPDQWSGPRQVHAVAGIGDPRRFYDTLRTLGFVPVEHSFPDHHRYRAADLQLTPDLAIVMTEKDAVKCADIGAVSGSWYLTVDAELAPEFFASLLQQLTLIIPRDTT